MSERRCVNCMELVDDKAVYCTHCGYHLEKEETTPFGLKENTILRGRYLVGRMLGQGGFGITYVGYDLALDIKVAIKEYFPMGMATRNGTVSNQILWNTTQLSKDQWQRGCDGFLKEARRMAKIDSLPGIVRVRDTFPENQTAYIIMDFIEGKNLKQHLRENGVMKFSECLGLLKPLMSSLDKMHKMDLIHRDISPDNIMLQPNGSLCLLDFGAAKDVSMKQNAASQQVTKKGFSPPEQYMENGRIGTWTDVYAMCATMYYCITGKLVPDAMERMWDDQLTFSVPMKQSLSEEMVSVFRSGLELRPEQRIQTIDELVKLFTSSTSVKTEEQKRIEEEMLRKEEEKRRQEEQKKQEQLNKEEGFDYFRKKQEEHQKQEQLNKEEGFDYFRKKQEEHQKQEQLNKEEGFDYFRKRQEEHQRAEQQRQKTQPGNKVDEKRQQEAQMREEAEKKRSKLKKISIALVAASPCLIIILVIILRPFFVWEWKDAESGEGCVITSYNDNTTSDTVKIPQKIFGKDVVNVKNSYIDVYAYEVDSDHPYLTVVDGVLFSKDMTTLVAYPNERYETYYEVPDGVATIQTYAFAGSELETISLPDSIEIIEDWAFYGSYTLNEILIPKSVKMIEKHVFAVCPRLQSVTIAEDCIVEEDAFREEVVINYYEPNFLMEDMSEEIVLGGAYYREEIKTINFVDSISNIPEEAEDIWDVSRDQNESVLAWVIYDEQSDLYDLYIGSDDVVSATNCHDLFSYYTNVESINFNDCFSTKYVTDMTDMFEYCCLLESLDCSSFDTSSVETMFGMFYHCESLTEPNVSSFDTSKVTNMSWMFAGCEMLNDLDLNHFYVSNVEKMRDMFYRCESLTNLDISSWILEFVEDKYEMFAGTPLEDAYF